MENRRWIVGEYRQVTNKRCMQADVLIGPDGKIVGFPDSVRNRIRQAAIKHLGCPVSVQDIGAIIGVKGPAVRAKMAGRRHFTDGEKSKIEIWLGQKIF